MANINGLRDTNNILQDQRVIDMTNVIYLLEPDASPLVVLTSKLSKREAFSPDVLWLEDTLIATYVTESGSLSSGGTTLNLSSGNGANIIPQTILINERTGETVLVTAVATDALTITRGYGSVAGTAGNDGDKWFTLGTANQEGSTAPQMVTSNKTKAVNYLQFFRRPFGATDIEINSLMYGGNDLDYQRRKNGIEFLREIEKAFVLGRKKEDLTTTHPTRVCGGLLDFISTNVTDMGGTMNEGQLSDFLRSAFRYGSTKKLLLSAPLPVDSIAMFAQNRLRLIPRDQTFGIAISEYISPHGTVGIVKDNILADGSVFSGYGFLIDMENLVYRFQRNLDVHIVQNIQTNDTAGKEDEYRAVVAPQIMLEKTHAIFKNVLAT